MTRGKRNYNGRRGNATGQLRDAVQHEPRRANTASEEEGKADVRVEEPARRAEEQPGGHEQAEPESRRDVERLLEGRPLYRMRALGPAKRQQQKHGRPDKFVNGCL